VQISVDFLAPSWLGDCVGLELTVDRIGAKSMQLAFACRDASGELRLSMRQTRVAMCLRHQAGIDLPPDLRSALALSAPDEN
jgi:4-hydroxybenzoyl-CoA thioesterase